VTAHVHQGAIDVLGPVATPSSIHQAKFSMGTVLGLIAVHGSADLEGFEHHALSDERVATVRDKVHMQLDPQIDALYPDRWVGRVSVTTTDGRSLEARIDEPKGDPGNTLTTAELESKAIRLARFRSAATEDEMRQLIQRIWNLENAPGALQLLPKRIRGS
jgi:2-methylcitrate dehydratase PrpD